jgi:hypothetical protein
MRKTRFKELGYAKHAPNLWRILDSDTGAAMHEGGVARGFRALCARVWLTSLARFASDTGARSLAAVSFAKLTRLAGLSRRA